MRRFLTGTLGLTAAAVAALAMLASCEALAGLVEGSYFQPGSSRSNAARIELDETYTVHLADANDEHWFRVQTGNDGVWDQVRYSVTDVDGNVRAAMVVQDRDGVNKINSTAPNDGANLIREDATLGGEYFVRVTNHWLSGTGLYRLTVTNLDANDAYEPNDTRGTAYDLGGLPAVGIEGTILHMTYHVVTNEYGGDFDWFTFETVDENDVEVAITQVSSTLRIGIRIYNEAGTRLAQVTADNMGQTGMATISSVEPGQRYFVGLFGAIKTPTHYEPTTGSYTMSITQPDP